MLFCERCIKCALAKTHIESKHWVKCCGFRRIIRCDGFESNIITIKLLSSLLSTNEIPKIFINYSMNNKLKSNLVLPSIFYIWYVKFQLLVICLRLSFKAARDILFKTRGFYFVHVTVRWVRAEALRQCEVNFCCSSFVGLS